MQSFDPTKKNPEKSRVSVEKERKNLATIDVSMTPDTKR